MMHGGGDAINKILELWVEGFTFSQISIEVGLSKKEVSHHVYTLRVSGAVKLRAKPKITILDLRYNSCRYIVGNDEDLGALYCGEVTSQRSYCKEHYALCYYKPDKK
jgi:hypothetical protein